MIASLAEKEGWFDFLCYCKLILNGQQYKCLPGSINLPDNLQSFIVFLEIFNIWFFILNIQTSYSQGTLLYRCPDSNYHPGIELILPLSHVLQFYEF